MISYHVLVASFSDAFEWIKTPSPVALVNMGPVAGPSAGFHLLLVTVTGLQRQAPILPFLRNLLLSSQQPPNSRLQGCLSSPAQSCAAWKCYGEIFINIFGSVRTCEGSIDLSGDARAGAI